MKHTTIYDGLKITPRVASLAVAVLSILLLMLVIVAVIIA